MLYYDKIVIRKDKGQMTWDSMFKYDIMSIWHRIDSLIH